MEKFALTDYNRDPTLDDYTGFRVVEEEVRGSTSHAQELSTESAEMYAQEWKDVLTQLVQHPKITEAEDGKLKRRSTRSTVDNDHVSSGDSEM